MEMIIPLSGSSSDSKILCAALSITALAGKISN